MLIKKPTSHGFTLCGESKVRLEHRRGAFSRRTWIATLLFALCAVFEADATDWHEGVLPDVGPLLDSEVIETVSARRLFPTQTSNHRFWVLLPAGFDPNEPAGLLLYNHGWGSGGGDTPPWFHKWESAFGDENMVFVKMSFQNNPSTSSTHQNSIKYAIAKVAATYKIILGRGVLTGFSAGGLPASRLISDLGGWPFNHVLAKSMRFEIPIPQNLAPMSWTFAVGQNEWNSYNLGQTATSRMNELVEESELGGSLDLHLHVVADTGHNVALSDDTIGPTVAAYRRSAAFLAPFIYQPDYSETELQPIVDACQDLDLGTAVFLISEFIDTTPDAILITKALELRILLENRIDEMFLILAELGIHDPVLTEYYASVGSEQLVGHPRGNEMLSLAQTIRDGYAFPSMASATETWHDEMSDYLDNTSQVEVLDNAIEDVHAIRSQVYGESLVGQMSEEFLALNGLQYVPEPKADSLQIAGILFLFLLYRYRLIGMKTNRV